MDVIVTSGGLGPTADDLTAEVVAAFAGPRDAPRRGAGGPDRGDPRAAAGALALNRSAGCRSTPSGRWAGCPAEELRRGRAAGGQPQAGDGARGRDRARAGRDRARAGGARRRRDGRRAPGPAGRAAADVGGGAGDRGAAGRAGRRRRLRAADPAAVRAAGVRDRQDAARRRGRRRAARPARDHDLPAARRDRDRDGLRAGRRPRDYAAFEAAVLERHGADRVRARRRDDRRAGGDGAARAAACGPSPSRSRAPAG